MTRTPGQEAGSGQETLRGGEFASDTGEKTVPAQIKEERLGGGAPCLRCQDLRAAQKRKFCSLTVVASAGVGDAGREVHTYKTSMRGAAPAHSQGSQRRAALTP